MGVVLSVAGKGGVGKTTFSALMLRELCDSNRSVLAIDADPNYNLGESLGIAVERTIGALREELMKTKDDLPAGVSKQELIEYQIRIALQEEDCFDLLTMGRQEGPGCYCYINSILRSFIDALSSKYDYVLIDNEAGLEHLSRRTTVGSNVLFVISDTSAVSLRAAGRIARLADDMELQIARKVLVLNRSDEAPAEKELSLTGYDFDARYHVRKDAVIGRLSEEGKSLSDLGNVTPAVEDVRQIIAGEIRRKRLSG